MSNITEIENTISVINKHSPIKDANERTCIMHCVSAYPTKNIDANLNCLSNLKKFSPYIGYSDHTIGTEAALVAVSLGSRIIEKHFTISKNYSNFRDHKLSADPNELKDLITSVRKVEELLGSGNKSLFHCEKDTYFAARRSLVASRELKKGTVIKNEDLIALRPLKDIPAEKIKLLIGKKLKKNIKKGDNIKEKDLN